MPPHSSAIDNGRKTATPIMGHPSLNSSRETTEISKCTYLLQPLSILSTGIPAPNQRNLQGGQD
jgi:hypothetical protein